MVVFWLLDLIQLAVNFLASFLGRFKRKKKNRGWTSKGRIVIHLSSILFSGTSSSLRYFGRSAAERDTCRPNFEESEWCWVRAVRGTWWTKLIDHPISSPINHPDAIRCWLLSSLHAHQFYLHTANQVNLPTFKGRICVKIGFRFDKVFDEKNPDFSLLNGLWLSTVFWKQK